MPPGLSRGPAEAGGAEHRDQGEPEREPGDQGQGPGDHVHPGGAPGHYEGQQEQM